MDDTLLIEIGCEEIPARMIPSAAEDLARRLTSILDQAGISRGEASSWGGCRRLVARVSRVAESQADREELVLGPPASAAFGPDGARSPAAIGFARKHAIDPAELAPVETEKGVYAGFRRKTRGLSVGQVLAKALPPAVEGMAFPKTMRWGSGRFRWVRPVHWLLAIHGDRLLPLSVFGVASDARSRGHRFLSPGPVPVPHPDAYAAALRAAFVVADPAERRLRLSELLRDAASAAGGELLTDPALLEEVVDLVEWPGVVAGRFARSYLELPREILVTTLRHHQKSFSVQSAGKLLPSFLAVANTDRDPAGNIRRGNEWVIGGRLEDARFFWEEDRKRPLADRVVELSGVVFHAKGGSYADKSARSEAIAAGLVGRLGLGGEVERTARSAARLAKADLQTGLVGEFPELQGIVGGLLLRAEGGDERIAEAIYEHYRPLGAEDAIPRSLLGRIVSASDRLDTIAVLLASGETPTGSRDPFGLRRAANGLFRIVLESRWSLSLRDLWELSASSTGRETVTSVFGFLEQRLREWLRETGFTPNEIGAVLLAARGEDAPSWPLPTVVERLDAIRGIRDREDFAHLVELTKRVANIRKRNAELASRVLDEGKDAPAFADPEPAVRDLEESTLEVQKRIEEESTRGNFRGVVDLLASLVEPVERFFTDALVIDEGNLATTSHRLRLLGRLETMLTRHFDIRELPGEAGRRG